MAQSKTGSGKTLAYLSPIIEKLQFQKNEALILVPTRELAKQINSVVKDLKIEKVRSMTIYGGVSINNQINKLKQGVNIIIGTPGRIIDLFKRLLAASISIYIGIQTILIVGGNLRLLPLTGVTLPFVSYGGSSLLTSFVALLLLLLISNHMDEEPAPLEPDSG